MPKLSAKELSKYDEATQHLGARFPHSLRSIWEIIKPVGVPHAVVAGFMVESNDRPRIVILTVSNEGRGWEIFGAPSSAAIGDSFQALANMWRYSDDNQTGT